MIRGRHNRPRIRRRTCGTAGRLGRAQRARPTQKCWARTPAQGSDAAIRWRLLLCATMMTDRGAASPHVGASMAISWSQVQQLALGSFPASEAVAGAGPAPAVQRALKVRAAGVGQRRPRRHDGQQQQHRLASDHQLVDLHLRPCTVLLPRTAIRAWPIIQL